MMRVIIHLIEAIERLIFPSRNRRDDRK